MTVCHILHACRSRATGPKDSSRWCKENKFEAVVVKVHSLSCEKQMQASETDPRTTLCYTWLRSLLSLAVQHGIFLRVQMLSALAKGRVHM